MISEFKDIIRSTIATIAEELPEDTRARLREKAKGLTLWEQLQLVSQEAMKGYREPDFLRGRE